MCKVTTSDTGNVVSVDIEISPDQAHHTKKIYETDGLSLVADVDSDGKVLAFGLIFNNLIHLGKYC